jgi:hypothetical protein
MPYADVLERLYNLRRDKQDRHERPHKPVLILALLDLVEAGLVAENRFFIDHVLFETWKSYFEIVKSANDRPTVEPASSSRTSSRDSAAGQRRYFPQLPEQTAFWPITGLR